MTLVTAKSSKFLEENTGESLHKLGLSKGFSGGTKTRSPKQNYYEWTLSKFKSSLLQKTQRRKLKGRLQTREVIFITII